MNCVCVVLVVKYFQWFFALFCIEIDRFLHWSKFLRVKIAFIQYLQFSFVFSVTKTDKTENKLDTLILFVCLFPYYSVDARSDKLINILVRTSLSMSKGNIYRISIGLSTKPSESLFPIIFAGLFSSPRKWKGANNDLMGTKLHRVVTDGTFTLFLNGWWWGRDIGPYA